MNACEIHKLLGQPPPPPNRTGGRYRNETQESKARTARWHLMLDARKAVYDQSAAIKVVLEMQKEFET